jgi:TolB-like protein
MFINNKKMRETVSVRLGLFFIVTLVAFLAGCSVISAQKGASFSSGRWMVLPFQNYSQNPRAGEQVEELVATLLRVRGITDLDVYQQPDEDRSGLLEFNDRRRLEKALSTAVKSNVSYAITGSVDEWQYKLGVGSEPAVGLTLRIIEVSSGKVVWSGSGARSGWSAASLSGTAQKLVKELISSIEIAKS